jgi:CubicO group peptidase (beta-lactamase class C family)
MAKLVRRVGPAILVLAIATPVPAQLSDAQRAGVDSIFAEFNQNTPGCAIGIGQNGKTLIEQAYGMANLEYSVPLKPTSVFEIGSVSKQFTAAAILLLAERAVLSLDDDIRKWIPELPDFGKAITIRMLANHTSGLRDQWGLLTLKNSPPGSAVHSLDLIVDLVAHQHDLNFPPNDQYLYSNTNFALLAVIVGRASGKSLAEFSQENIFKPLGMTHTQWRDDFTRVVRDRATAYNGGPRGYNLDMPFTNVYGNGGLLTTVGDLLIWWDALSNNRLGSPAFLQKMTTTATLNSGQKITYALGLTVDIERGMRTFSHSGSTAGYRANLVHYPDRHTTIAVVCNNATGDPGRKIDRVAQVLFPQLTANAAAAVVTPTGMSATDVQALAGLYRDANTNDVYRLEARAGKLVAPGVELVPISVATLRNARTGVDVTVRRDGKRVLMQYPSANVTAVTLERVDTVALSADQLKEYVGGYWSAELDLRYDVDIDQGRLIIKRRLMPTLTLNPTYKDAFVGGGNWVFARDASGKINALLHSQGRIRQVRFDRLK